jgi:hypothetical protein
VVVVQAFDFQDLIVLLSHGHQGFRGVCHAVGSVAFLLARDEVNKGGALHHQVASEEEEDEVVRGLPAGCQRLELALDVCEDNDDWANDPRSTIPRSKIQRYNMPNRSSAICNDSQDNNRQSNCPLTNIMVMMDY